MGLFKNLFKSQEEKTKAKKMEIGLKNNSSYSFSNLKSLLERKKTIDESFYNELEELLLVSDMGIDYTFKFINNLKAKVKKDKVTTIDGLKESLFSTFSSMYMKKEETELVVANPLTVYLFMGVNGSGKTTSIAKLAYKLVSEGKKVVVAAADTFRAGAVEQLQEWSKRIGFCVVTNPSGDPSSVIFDALKKAKSEGFDYLLCDTAGRLQTKVNLMKELEKIYRVIGREVPNAPHEALLVIDSTTGTNGLRQAEVFNESCKITGLVLTKLDGTSKGGVALTINNVLSVPIKLYGFGEKETDFDTFDINSYLYSLFNNVLFED